MIRDLTDAEAQKLVEGLLAALPVGAVGSVPGWAVSLVLQGVVRHGLPWAVRYLSEIGVVRVQAEVVEIVDERP